MLWILLVNHSLALTVKKNLTEKSYCQKWYIFIITCGYSLHASCNKLGDYGKKSSPLEHNCTY